MYTTCAICKQNSTEYICSSCKIYCLKCKPKTQNSKKKKQKKISNKITYNRNQCQMCGSNISIITIHQKDFISENSVENILYSLYK